MARISRSKEKGFMLAEMLVVLFVILILTGLIVANYRAGQRQLALERAANKLAQDIRRVQEMAMSAQEVNGEIPLRGYGIYLKDVPPPQIHNSYILFANKADATPDYFYYKEAADTVIEDISFEGEEIKIKDLNLPYLNIVFIPPDPIVFVGKDGETRDEAIITISLIKDTTKTKTITVNKAGLVKIE